MASTLVCRICETPGHHALYSLPGQGGTSARCGSCLRRHIEQLNAEMKALEEERIGESINDGRRDIAAVLVEALQPSWTTPRVKALVNRITNDPDEGIAELLASCPVPIILFCPSCQQRHIDEGKFATKPHHTHACQHCGFSWRPAIAPTVGVRFLPGFKNKD